MTGKQRRTPQDWIDLGFRVLVTGGPPMIRAEVLARELGATKGSFYWHFADVPAFRRAMIAEWQRDGVAALAACETARSTPAGRLRLFAQTMAGCPDGKATTAATEAAFRAWALSDAEVAAAVEARDAERSACLKRLLDALDITNPEIPRLIEAAGIGMNNLPLRDGQDGAETMGTLVDLILALR